MEALFGRLNRLSPLKCMYICDVYARGSLAPFTKNLCFFPSLIRLYLINCDMDEHDFCCLLKNLRFIPHLEVLDLTDNRLGHAVRLIVPHLFELQKLEFVHFGQGGCSEEDLEHVRKAVKEKLPQLKITAL